MFCPWDQSFCLTVKDTLRTLKDVERERQHNPCLFPVSQTAEDCPLCVCVCLCVYKNEVDDESLYI